MFRIKLFLACIIDLPVIKKTHILFHREIGFIKKNREAKIKAILEPSEESIAQRTMFEDGFCVPSALAIIQERKKMKDYNLDPPERDDTID